MGGAEGGAGPAPHARTGGPVQASPQQHCVSGRGLLESLLTRHTCFRFASAEGVWSLASAPSELLGALEEHADILIHQLGSEEVNSDLQATGEASVAVQVFSHCSDFAMAAAGLAK